MTPGRPSTPGESAGAWVEDKLRRYGTEFLSAVSIFATAIASVPGVFLGPIIWIGIGVALALVAAVFRGKLTESLHSIRNERDDAVERADASIQALRDAIQPLAHNLSAYLELTESHQRLSVYCHHVSEFRILARVAKNPHFQSGGRSSYPETQGVIGTVWTGGNASVRAGNSETWEDWVARFGFTPEEAAGLKMKSHSIAAVRLEYNREPVGIVLIESENRNGIKPAQFEKLQNSYITSSLAELLAIAGPLILFPADQDAEQFR
ncbi:hypothetical protein Leucomu_13575 [Leucobacter muris]|uniref:GAF domain-containing protein n=1 Tax=Leucobacter muris TaxID=1935379 RepID=A0ABX5QI74_9MICO|nr:hypothetical protein [Leucobacter muris]QAB18803.1 hypothetical protein Leucomu_13575 [Leucobacter muris]